MNGAGLPGRREGRSQWNWFLAVWAVCLFGNCQPGRAASVTIDGAQRYQSMDGFGGTEHWLFPPSSEYSRIFDDLGVSLLRFRMLRYTESVPDEPGDEARDNDNGDPFVIDWNGVATSYFGAVAPMLQAAQSRGCKLFGNIMCPPPWMKTTGIAEGAGSLKIGYEDELVEFILIWVKGMQTYHNVHIDYVNFENEPNYERSYPSCYMSRSQIQTLTRKLGARFEAEGITTKIVPPETSNLPTFLSWAASICEDPVATDYIDRLSTHSYNIDFYDPDANNSNWASAHDLASGYNKPLWLTEYCLDYGTTKGTWAEAIALVQHVHNALEHGQVSAWLYHELYRDPSGSPLALIDPAGPYPKFYALKQYFRYVRPQAVRIEASSDDPDLLVTAFEHDEDDVFTMVVINRGSTAETIDCSLSGLGGELASLDLYRTSVTQNCEDMGSLPVSEGSFSATLPPQSITTFTGVVSEPVPALLASEPPADGTLPKTQNNIIMCMFDAPITLPLSHDPLVITELADPNNDVSASFSYSVDPNDTGDATVQTLKATESGPMLPNQTWYRVRSAPSWAEVVPFGFNVCTLRGDANDSGRVTTADYIDVKNHMAERTDARYDVNGSARITTADYIVVKDHMGHRAPAKP